MTFSEIEIIDNQRNAYEERRLREREEQEAEEDD
jgi:hypothetical protein